MKRIIIILLVGMSIVSCENTDTENSSQQVVKTVEAEDTLVIDESIDYSEIGFQLMETETIGELKLDMKVEAVEKITGKPHNMTAFEYWGADGYDHQSRYYQDSTIDVDFIKLDDGSLVSNMVFVNNNAAYKTAKGIGIGSSKNEIIKAYNGQISSVSDESIIAGSIYGGLIFYLKEGKVTSIFLGAAAE